MLHGKVAALQVDGENPIPRLLRQLDDAADLNDADIVVEHVNSPEPLQAGRYDALHVRPLRDVGLASLRFTALARMISPSRGRPPR